MAKSRRLLFGENIQRYAFRESRRRASYSFIDYQDVGALRLPAIVAQRTTAVEQERRIVATLFEPKQLPHELVGENSVIVYEIKSIDDGLFFLGILGSRFIDYYFRLFNSNTHVASGELNRIPMPLHNTQTLCAAVRTVLEKRAHGMDATGEERKIDDEVYRLYGLTAEEVALVERSFGRGERKAEAAGAAKGEPVADEDEEEA